MNFSHELKLQVEPLDTKFATAKTFKNFYSDLAGNVLAKLLKLPNQYTINFIPDYYKKLSLSENFKLDSTTEDCLSFWKMLRS